MNSYRLSEEADADIRAIFMNSVTQWGLARAEDYTAGLQKALETLNIFPNIGRDASHIKAGYFRLDHASHAVFFRKTETGIFIVRILHQRQQPVNYL